MKIFNPLVSIIIPVYNGEKYVKEAIDSALSQTYKNNEILVINDGSIDKTEEIVKAYGDKIRYFNKENGGVASALNLGIQEMKGEYFSWLSHDDVYYPDKIEKQINLLTTLDDKNTIMYSNVEYINKDAKTIRKTNYELQNSIKSLNSGLFPVFKGYANGCALLINKECFKDDIFNEELQTANDYDMWFRLFKKFPVRFISDVLIKYRFHDEQGTKVIKKTFRVKESDKVWASSIEGLSEKEITGFNVDRFFFFWDLAHRMKKASNEKSHKIALEKAKQYYGNRNPVISVIMPCYNAEQYLAEAIDSVLVQTYPDFELIIVDDNSTDNSWEIIKKYEKYDFRIRITKNKYGKGISGGMNTGLDLSKGKYITRMDSDDISSQERLKEQIHFLEKNKDYGFCSVNMSAFGDITLSALFKEEKAPLEWLFFWSNSVPSAAAMFRGKIIRKNEIRFEDYEVAQDYDFLSQFAIHTKGYVLYDKPLYQYRIYSGSNFQKKKYLALEYSKDINRRFIKKITGNDPPHFHDDLTTFAVEKEKCKDLSIHEIVEWHKNLIDNACTYWGWSEKEYKSAVEESEGRILKLYSGKNLNKKRMSAVKKGAKSKARNKNEKKVSIKEMVRRSIIKGNVFWYLFPVVRLLVGNRERMKTLFQKIVNVEKRTQSISQKLDTLEQGNLERTQSISQKLDRLQQRDLERMQSLYQKLDKLEQEINLRNTERIRKEIQSVYEKK